VTVLRSLTLWQPWATLVALGAKRWETRSWPTDYRGPLLIHAAARRPPDELELGREHARALYDLLARAGGPPRELLVRGAVVAACRLADCRPARATAISEDLGPDELIAGDYSVGRHAFRLDAVAPLDRPYLARGFQGFFSLDVPALLLPEAFR